MAKTVYVLSKRESSLMIILSYIAVFLLIAVTKGSIPYTFHPKAWWLVFVSVAFGVRLNSSKLKWHSSLLYLLLISFMMIFTSIYNDSFDTDFIQFILYGIFSFIIIGSFTLDTFKHYFLNVVFGISILSIVIFITSFYTHLPLKYMENEYVSIGYYMFQAIEWNNEPLNRNTGIFTEPGCFQYCLNYALLLYLDDIVNHNIGKLTRFKLLVVVITLITCASTAGYIVLMLIILYVVYKVYEKNIFKLVFIGIPLGILSIGALYSSEMVSEKLDEDNKDISVIMRTADAFAMMEMISDHPFVGNGGIGTKKYQSRVVGYGAMTAGTGASNGVLVAMAVLGLLWLPLYCYYCGKACKRMFSTAPAWFVVILTLLIHSNEYFIFSPIIYIFIFPYKTIGTINNSLSK